MNRRAFLPLLIVPFVASLAGCGDLTKAKTMADAAVVTFHQQFNDGKFKELYDAAHPDLRKATSEADFIKLLDAMHRKLGKVTSSENAGWSLNTFNFVTSIKMTQTSQFETGTGVEAFAWVLGKDSVTLQRYDIESRDLMEK